MEDVHLSFESVKLFYLFWYKGDQFGFKSVQSDVEINKAVAKLIV